MGRRLYLLGLLGRISQPTGKDGGGGNRLSAEARPLDISNALHRHDGAEGRQEPEQPRFTPLSPQDSALYRLSLWWTFVLSRRTQVRDHSAYTKNPHHPPNPHISTISTFQFQRTLGDDVFPFPSNVANPNAAWAIRSSPPAPMHDGHQVEQGSWVGKRVCADREKAQDVPPEHTDTRHRGCLLP